MQLSFRVTRLPHREKEIRRVKKLEFALHQLDSAKSGPRRPDPTIQRCPSPPSHPVPHPREIWKTYRTIELLKMEM